jgi:hypothetical protein
MALPPRYTNPGIKLNQEAPVEPQGLLGRLGSGLKNMTKDPNFYDKLAVGLGGMTTNPNTGLIKMAQNRIERRGELGRVNATAKSVVAKLRAEGKNQMADMIEQNPSMAAAYLNEIIKSQLRPELKKATSPLQYDDFTGQAFYVQMGQDGKPERINVEGTVSMTADEKAALAATKLRGVDQEKRLQDSINEGVDAVKGLPILRRGLELLATVNTGGIDNARLQIKKFFGVEGADEGELSANLGRAVLSQLRQTFGAAFTEREGARLDNLSARFGASTASNTRLLQQAENIILSAARRGIEAATQVGDNYAVADLNKYVSGAYDISLSDDDLDVKYGQ